MKPLRETVEFSTEGERKLADLFASAERYSPDPIKKRRIGVQLQAGQRRRGRARAWQPVVAIGLFFAGTAAAATLGHQLWSTTAPSVVERPPTAAIPHPQSAPEDAHTATIPSVDAREAAPANTVEQQQNAVTNHVSPSTHHGAAISRAHARTPHTEDPTRVAEALRALRKEGDPDRAQSLLSKYMKDNPRGALSEEALALSIEAAHARKDPAAKTYARRYLSRYPAGRHRHLAQRVLSE